MNRLLKYLFLILTVSFISCSTPIKEYRVDSKNQQAILKLYSDSTFVEKIKEGSEYSGNWFGNLSDDSTFTTTATKVDFKIMTLTPTKTYKIKKEQAIRIDNQEYTKELEFESDTTIVVEWLGLSCFCPNWIEIKHLNELKNDTLGVIKDEYSISLLPSDSLNNIYNHPAVGAQTPLVFKLKGRYFRKKMRHEAKGMSYVVKTFQYYTYEMIEY
jgi:hypothetical protein